MAEVVLEPVTNKHWEKLYGQAALRVSEVAGVQKPGLLLQALLAVCHHFGL